MRCKRRAVGELAHILGAVDDDEMAAAVDKAGIAAAQPPVVGHRLAGGVRLLVIALEYRGGADQHLAVLGNAHFGTWCDPADRVRDRFAVGL